MIPCVRRQVFRFGWNPQPHNSTIRVQLQLQLQLRLPPLLLLLLGHTSIYRILRQCRLPTAFQAKTMTRFRPTANLLAAHAAVLPSANTILSPRHHPPSQHTTTANANEHQYRSSSSSSNIIIIITFTTTTAATKSLIRSLVNDTACLG